MTIDLPAQQASNETCWAGRSIFHTDAILKSCRTAESLDSFAGEHYLC